jgi:putative DNA primase/helicase
MLEFITTMQAAGLSPPDNIVPDKIHRFPGIGHTKPNLNGWCLMFEDGQGGVYGDWGGTGLWQIWQAAKARPQTEAERNAFRQKVRKAQEKAKQERDQRQRKAAIKAVKRWDAAQPASPEHPYLLGKRMQAYGVRQESDTLILPLRDETGTLWSLQTIAPDGRKLFNPAGCRAKGLYFPLGGKPDLDMPLCIVEGFATGAAIHEATGYPVAVAFNAGNLEPVAKSMRAKFPDNPLIICADDDQKPDSDNNPGIEAAKRAALAVGGKVAYPGMGKKSDFWDLWSERGEGAVRDAVSRASLPQCKETPKAAKSEKKRSNKKEKKPIVEEIEPYFENVDGAELFAEICDVIRRHVVMPESSLLCCALWVMLTYGYRLFRVLPILAICSPEKRCGKSTLLTVLGGLSNKTLMASNISSAAVYRVIEACEPTLLIDEADTFLPGNDELRGVLNSGHTQSTAFVVRVHGETMEPEKFSTFCPKAIALIGKRNLKDTLIDRAVCIDLRRKLPSDNVNKLPLNFETECLTIRQKIKRWTEDNRTALQEPPYVVAGIGNDRTADNWEPLLSIAKSIGRRVLDEAVEVLQNFSGLEMSNESRGVQLLSDIRAIFDEIGKEKLPTKKLIEMLIKIDDAPWADYRHGKPITDRQIAALLKEFGISPGNVPMPEGKRPKGYEREKFTDAFSRYIPPPPHSLSATPLPCNNIKCLEENLSATQENEVADTEDNNLLKSLTNSGVADKTPSPGGFEDEKSIFIDSQHVYEEIF